MLVIEKEQTFLVNDRTLVVEASDLELSPGEWPDFVAVLDIQNKGFLFQRMECFQVEKDGMGRYITKDGSFELHILND